MSDNGYDRVKGFAKFLIDKSENGYVDVSTISNGVKEWCDEMHEQTKLERERINNKIHDYCRGGSMLGKGCLSCVLNSLSICGDGTGNTKVPMSRLREADKILDEMVG